MNKVQMCKMWLREHGDLFIDLVRIYLGCGLVVKAVFLMNHRDFLAQMIGETDATWMGGAFIAQYVILAHLFGGAMLALGMVTRLLPWRKGLECGGRTIERQASVVERPRLANSSK